MAKKRDRSIYEPPRARDLSEFSATGQDPRGICQPGGSLTFEVCTDGSSPEGGECAPYGIAPEMGYCSDGNNAVEGCNSGGIHT